MSRVMAAFIGVAVLAATAEAGVSYFSLEPRDPGPYAPNQVLGVDVFFHNVEGQSISLRQVTLDFSSTDPAIGLPSTFAFDSWFSNDFGPTYWLHLENLPKVDVLYTEVQPSVFDLVADGEVLHIGGLGITLPNEPGSYTLDAINAAAPDLNTGAYVGYGFEQRVELHHTLGNLAGGTLDLVVVPEPATLVLFAIVACCCGCRRYARGMWGRCA